MNRKTVLFLAIGALLTAFAQPVVISGVYLNPLPAFALSALIGLIPIALIYTSDDKNFLKGFTFGIFYYLFSLFWIAHALTNYAGLTLLEGWGIFALLLLVQAPMPGLALWIAGKMEQVRPSIFNLPAAWTAMELIRSYYLGGFTYADPGYAFARIPLMSQAADILGIHGITFLTMTVSSLAAVFFKKKVNKKEAAVAALLLCAWPLYGAFRLNTHPAGKEIKIGIVQPNVEQEMKWNPFNRRAIVKKLTTSNKKLATLGSSIAVWPEAALPWSAKRTGYLIQRDLYLPTITGALTYERKNDRTRLYNSAVALDKNGKITGIYDKVQLVPFGEYVPWWVLLPVKKIVPAAGDLYAGDSVKLLEVNGAKFAPLICYESAFPRISRKMVNMGAAVLVNITNDAWFGHSSGPYQSLYMAAVRCIENRTPMVRAANTGISAFIDKFGRIKATIRFGIYGTKTMAVQTGHKKNKTIYGSTGYLFPWLCLFVAAALSIKGIKLGRKHPNSIL